VGVCLARLKLTSSSSQLSLYFPDIEGVSLATKTKTHTTDLFPGKVSLVVLSSFKSSEVRNARDDEREDGGN
jgi:hypothetical protein